MKFLPRCLIGKKLDPDKPVITLQAKVHLCLSTRFAFQPLSSTYGT